MPASVRRLARGRTLTLLVGAGLLAGALVTAGAVAARKPDCRQVIAGTYLIPAGSIVTLSSDGTITGNLSETSQVAAGQGDTFLGAWQCSGTGMTGRDFRWVDSTAGRKISRTDWEGTFSPDAGGTLGVTYTFYRLDEDATAEEILDADPAFDDEKVLTRIATP
jgi:hypothetical protein